MSGIRPWDMQPGESPESFEAFALYRDLGIERSIRRVGRELGKSGSLIFRWSSENDWQYRVEEWDRFLDQSRQETYLTALELRAETYIDLLGDRLEELFNLPVDQTAEWQPNHAFRIFEMWAQLTAVRGGFHDLDEDDLDQEHDIEIDGQKVEAGEDPLEDT